jgi:hypothetical protein
MLLLKPETKNLKSLTARGFRDRSAGMRPIHHPEALQYQPRQVGEAELQASGVASPVEWREVRARLEKEAAEQAEREIGLEVEAWARKVSGGQA